MDTNRLINLIKVLESRDQSIPGLADRIVGLKNELAAATDRPAPLPIKKKKKIVTQSIEVEVDE